MFGKYRLRYFRRRNTMVLLVIGVLCIILLSRSQAVEVSATTPEPPPSPTLLGPFSPEILPSLPGDTTNKVNYAIDLTGLGSISGFHLNRVELSVSFDPLGASCESEVHFRLTGPAGTVFDAPERAVPGCSRQPQTFRAKLPDFAGEAYAGVWTVALWDDYDDQGDDETITDISLTLTAAEPLVLNDGLLGWWPLDETASRTIIRDRSGFGNDGRPVNILFPDGGDPFSYGGSSRSVQFTNNAYIEVPNQHGQLGGTDLTLMAWVKPEWEPNTGCHPAIFSMVSGGLRFFVEIDKNYQSLRVWNGSASYVLALPHSFIRDYWTHIAVTWEGDTLKAYVNGELIGTDNNMGLDANASTRPLWIGYDGYCHWNGFMSDVRMFDRSLAANEIGNHVGVGWEYTDALHVKRLKHTATVLDDGRVLVVGGERYDNGWLTVAQSELFNPQTNSWSIAAVPDQPRYEHQAFLLDDGRVLIAGGIGAGSVRNLELYDPATDRFTLGPTYEAGNIAAAKLSDGRILLTGGFLPIGSGRYAKNAAFIFDPADDSLTRVADMIVGRDYHKAVLLQDGRVLAIGGRGNSGVLDSAEIYDPDTDSWTLVSNTMSAGRIYGFTASVLPNGDVVIVGGSDGTAWYSTVGNVDIYSVSGNYFYELETIYGRTEHTAITLWDGSILFSGGVTQAGPVAEIFRFDPDSYSFQKVTVENYSALPPLQGGRHGHTTTLLNDGRIMVAGGNPRGGWTDTGTVELYFTDPASAWSDRYEQARSAITAAGYYRIYQLQRLVGCEADPTNCAFRNPAMTVEQNYVDFAGGQLYWRFCADYDEQHVGMAPAVPHDSDDPDDTLTIDLYGYCPAWDDLTNTQRNNRYSGSLSSNGMIDIRNHMVTALQEFAVMRAFAPEQFILPQGAPLVEIGDDNYARILAELATIHTLFGNEFMVEAVSRPTIGGLGSEQIINEEIVQLERAYRQYELASSTILQLLEFKFGGAEDAYLSDHLTGELMQTLTYAGDQMVLTIDGITRREQLLNADDTDSILTRLDDSFSLQYAQALALANVATQVVPDDPNTGNVDEGRDFFANNGGYTLINNLGRLVQYAEAVRANLNPYGYDDQFVPLKTFSEMLEFTCGNPLTCDQIGGKLAEAETAEAALIAGSRDFDENFQELKNQLDALGDDFDTELTELCGSSDNDWASCDKGLMRLNRLDIIAANKTAALAWQRAVQIADLIRIESERANRVINVTLNTGSTIAAYDLAIGKLEAFRSVSTNFATDTASTYQGVENTATASVRGSAKVSANPLENEASVESSVEVATQGTLGAHWEQARGTTSETIFDPNAEAIASFTSMQTLAEAERDAVIEGANSNAEIKRLLLEQSNLLLEFRLAVIDYKKVISEHNLLAEQYQLLLDQRAGTAAGIQDSYLNKPYFRLVRDQATLRYSEKLDEVIQYTYLTAKALEYETLTPITYMDDLYKARNTAAVRDFLGHLANDYFAYNNDDFERKTYKISFARHLLGLTDENLNPNGMLSPSQVEALRTERFQLYLDRMTTTDASGEVVVFNFATLLDLPPGINYFSTTLTNNRIAGESTTDPGCTTGRPCRGLWLNLVTTQSQSEFNTDGLPELRLTHGGHATYKKMDGSGEMVTYAPGAAVTIGHAQPVGFNPGGQRSASVTTHINMNPNVQTNPTEGTAVFSNLSVATNEWVLEIPLYTSTNDELDLAQLQDIEIRMDTVGFTPNNVTRRLQTQDDLRLAAVQAGEPMPEQALQAAESSLVANQVRPTVFVAESVMKPVITANTYTGLFYAIDPINLGSWDVGFDLFFNSDHTITGTACAGCSPLLDSDVTLTGSWNMAGDTPMFSFETAYFTDGAAGQGILRRMRVTGELLQQQYNEATGQYENGPFAGDPTDGVPILMGTYTEELLGFSSRPISVAGEFLLTQPTPDYSANLPPITPPGTNHFELFLPIVIK